MKACLSPKLFILLLRNLFDTFLYKFSVELQPKQRPIPLIGLLVYGKDILSGVHYPFLNISSHLSLNANLNAAPGVSWFFFAI